MTEEEPRDLHGECATEIARLKVGLDTVIGELANCSRWCAVHQDRVAELEAENAELREKLHATQE